MFTRGTEIHTRNLAESKWPTGIRDSFAKYHQWKQILPMHGEGTSLVIDNDYLAHLHPRDERIDFCLGSEEMPFNCLKFTECEVTSECVRSLAVFARTVIIEDSSFECEDIYFSLKNELEVRCGKIRFSTMRVVSKYVNFERGSLIDGNNMIITTRNSASLSGEYSMKTQFVCQSPEISISNDCTCVTKDLLFFPTKNLEIMRGASLRSKKLFIGGLDEKRREVVTGSAKVEVSGEVEGDKVSILTKLEVLLSGNITANELDCLSGKYLDMKECHLKARKLQVHAMEVCVDGESVLEGSEFSFLVQERVVLADLSSFQFDKFLAIECHSLVSVNGPSSESTPSASITKQLYRNGDVFITATESIELGGMLICRKLLLNCQTRSADVVIRENAKFDIETLIVIAGSSPGSEGRVGTSGDGYVVFGSGSEIRCSKLLVIESDGDVVLKGSLKRALCYSPNVVIKTPKSIKFVNCSVDVGESQLQFGDELVLCERARVYVSGKLFLAFHFLNQVNRGVLRLEKDCLLVARKDIVCQFGECCVEGTLASEEESILLGQNINQNPVEKEEMGGKKVVKLDQVIKKIVESLKPSPKPLLSLFNKFQEQRARLANNIRRIVHMKEEEEEEEEEEEARQKSFVMEYIFISGVVRAKKTVMLVSKDTTIQNGSSIKCTAEWDSTAILIYSNRSVFQCSSELDASNVLIVSPIVFQLLSLVRAHNHSISAAVLFRLGCLCNSTKTMLKVPLILSALNIVAPNVNKTLRKMRCDLVENFVEVVVLIERLAEARVEHREFEVFLVESLRMFKKHSHLAMLHSLELVHFVFQVVNLLVPKTALIITVNIMSIIRATMFLLFSVKNIRKSVKRYLTSERQNFILVEIVGEGIFSLYQVVGVVTSFTSLYNQIKNLRSFGMDSSTGVEIPSLRELPLTILNRTKDLVSRGPLSALSDVLGVFDTFVLNDYTKYAVGLFSYLPSNMSFSLLNLAGELQLGMYVANNSSACSLNGSVVVLSYNCSTTDLTSFSPRSNVVICNGSISENSTIGKVDRGVKISQRSLVLAGGRRVHDGGFHFGDRVALQTRSFEQQNNKFFYNHIGGFSVNDWKLQRLSEFRPVVSDASSTRTSTSRGDDTNAFEVYDSGVIANGVDKSVLRSGNNSIDSVLVEDGSVFFLKDTVLKVNEISGEVTLKNVQVKMSYPHNLSKLHFAGGYNSLVSDTDFNVMFPVHLADGAYVNIISPSTIFDGETYGNGDVAFYNAEIGENASVHHTGSSLIELKNEQELTDAIVGKGKFSNISNNGLVNFKVNGLLRISEEKFFYESSIRENQDLGIVADSIEVGLEVERKKGIRLLSVKDDVVIRKSITSKDGSVIINAKHGNVLIEDNVEKGTIATKCRLETKPLPEKSERSRLQKENVDASSRKTPFHKLIVVDGIEVVKGVEKIELCAKDSVVITANEGRIILDPCVIHGDESVVLQGNEGVSMKDICVTSVTSKSSRNPFYSKRKQVIKGVSETTKITSNGDISIIAVEGTISTSGICLTSNGGRILQRGRDGVYNESVVARTSISEKVHVLGGLSKEHRKEKHDVETPCVFQSNEGIYVESERGSIVNVGMLATGNGVCSFKAGENVLLERRTLNHEILLKKQGFDLSLSILGVNIFESSSTFFEILKMEFLENHLPPIGNSPIEVARSIEEGNVPEIAANLANALLIPGNLRFILDSPVKFGLKFNDYDVHNHYYDTLGEGKIEMDFLYINACDTVEFGNAFGFNVFGSVEIEADKLIESGAFLNYEIENISSGVGIGFEPFGGDLLHCVPSMSVDLSIVKETCSIAVCQIGNAVSMKVNVGEWAKKGSQTFAETVEGRVGTISFDSTPTMVEGKRHGISLGTTSLGLSDGHSRSSLIVDQTGLYAVNVDGFHVENVILEASRCPVGGTRVTIGKEVKEFEKVSGTSLGIDFSSVISLSAMAMSVGGSNGNISKLKGVGIERKDYVAIVQNSFENVDESEFHYRAIDSINQKENEASEMRNSLESVRQSYESLTRHDNSFVEDDFDVTEKAVPLLTPSKNVLKDKSFNLKFHYDLNYRLLRDGLEKMHREVVEEGLLPCLEGAAFEDVDHLLLFPVLDIFYDSSTSELDKYTQILFYNECEKAKYCNLTEDEKQEVFIFQSFLQDGGDFRDFTSLCNFYEERKQELSDEYAKKSMKKYVRETYPELYFSSGLQNLQDIEEVRWIFMDIKLTHEPDDPMVRQMRFEMDQYYAEQLYNASSWAELSSAQQNEIGRIREHTLMYQVTNQEVEFSEYLLAKEAQFVDYFANHHQEPDTNVLTSFGVLPIELLKEPGPIHSECIPYNLAQKLGNERTYAVPGSGLYFLVAPPEKSGWDGMCEYASSWKSCIIDYFFYQIAGKPDIDYQPSQNEIHIDASLRSFFSSMIDFIPFVNAVKWGFQSMSGYNPITKARLDWKERVFDLTFSIFYLPPVGSIIIGYGKGAVWEPMKCVWNVGKILVKRERSFKGVVETIKASGVAIVDSIALPTQHFGAYLEMGMLWGWSSGSTCFRSARGWWSKMGRWKTGFWNKWKWSWRRHWDITMTTGFAVNNRNFAFAPTVMGNGVGHSNHRPFMEFSKGDELGPFGGSKNNPNETLKEIRQKNGQERVEKTDLEKVQTLKDSILQSIEKEKEAWDTLQQYYDTIRRKLIRNTRTVGDRYFDDIIRVKRDFGEILHGVCLDDFEELVGREVGRKQERLEQERLEQERKLEREINQLLKDGSGADPPLQDFVMAFGALSLLSHKAQRWLLNPGVKASLLLKDGEKEVKREYLKNVKALDDSSTSVIVNELPSHIQKYNRTLVVDKEYNVEGERKKRKLSGKEDGVEMGVHKFYSPLRKNINDVHSPKELEKGDLVFNVGEYFPFLGREEMKKSLLRRIFSMRRFKKDFSGKCISQSILQNTNGGFTCVVGSSGIGKTTLLRKGLFSLKKVLNENRTEFERNFGGQVVGEISNILGDKKKLILLYLDQFYHSAIKAEKKDPKKNFQKRCLYSFYRTYCEYNNGSYMEFLKHPGVDQSVSDRDFELLSYIRRKMKIEDETEIVVVIALDDVQELIREYSVDYVERRRNVRRQSYFHSINDYLFELTMSDKNTCVVPVFVSTNTMGVEELKVSSGNHYEFVTVSFLEMDDIFELFTWLYNGEKRNERIFNSLRSSRVLREFLSVYKTNPGYVEYFCNIASQFKNGVGTLVDNRFSRAGWEKFIEKEFFNDKEMLLGINKRLASRWFSFRFCERSLWNEYFLELAKKEGNFVFDLLSKVVFGERVKRELSFGSNGPSVNDLESGGIVCLEPKPEFFGEFVMGINCNVLSSIADSLTTASVVFNFPLLNPMNLVLDDREKEIQDAFIMALRLFSGINSGGYLRSDRIVFHYSGNPRRHVYCEEILEKMNISRSDHVHVEINGKAAPVWDSVCWTNNIMRCIQSKRSMNYLYPKKKFNVKLEYEKCITEKSVNRILYEKLIQDELKKPEMDIQYVAIRQKNKYRDMNKVEQLQKKFDDKVRRFLDNMENQDVDFEFLFIADCERVEELGYHWESFEKGDYEKKKIRLIVNSEVGGDFDTVKEFYGNYFNSLLFLKSRW